MKKWITRLRFGELYTLVKGVNLFLEKYYKENLE
jgi:hypothetical protein